MKKKYKVSYWITEFWIEDSAFIKEFLDVDEAINYLEENRKNLKSELGADKDDSNYFGIEITYKEKK